MQLNTPTGDITAPTLINAGGTHTDATFFNGILIGTQQIIVTGNLPLNTLGDGVGYYSPSRCPNLPLSPCSRSGSWRSECEGDIGGSTERGPLAARTRILTAPSVRGAIIPVFPVFAFQIWDQRGCRSAAR